MDDHKGISYPQSTIQQVFEEIAGKYPCNTAIVTGDTDILYKELNEKANRMAYYIRQKGIGPDTLVGLLFDPSPDAIIAMLAVLKAGGAYLPIDAGDPAKRVSEIITDADIKLLISNTVSVRTRSFAVETILLDYVEEGIAAQPSSNPPLINSVHNLAYVIYTSGSTGKPKGVMIEHRNVIRLLFNDGFQFSFSDKDVWTQFHRYCFDFSVWEIFGALLYGGKLVLVPAALARDPLAVLQLVEKHKVTVFNQTPTAFYNFLSHALHRRNAGLNLRYVIFGGEKLRPLLLRDWRRRFPEIKLINMYGITETTVHVTYKEITEHEIVNDICNIGRPIPTTQGFVVDQAGNALPPYSPGELWVGGEGVARGYLHNEELTDQRFVLAPAIAKGKLYRSGDLVRILDNGELEYLGRIDDQVKIRGHRIEITEIEKKVADIAGILSNIVVLREQEPGDKHLICYYISSVTYNSGQCRVLLNDRLPEYMIPEFFVRLTSFPLTPNGKIDQSALPDPVPKYGFVVPPRTSTEAALLTLWQKSLGVQDFGVTNTFFELGGDSIKVLKLLYRINETFHTELDIAAFYAHSTIEKIADLIDNVSIEDQVDPAVTDEIDTCLDTIRKKVFDDHPPADLEDVYPMTDVQLGMVYNNLRSEETKTVYSDQKLHSLHLAAFDKDLFENTLMRIVADNETLRTAFNLDEYEIPLQFLYTKIKVDYKHFDLTEHTPSGQFDIISGEMAANRDLNFNFSMPGLFRVRTFQPDPETVLLLLHFHHSIIDGWSYAVFLKELKEVYQSLSNHRAHPPKNIRYRQRDHVMAEWVLKRQEKTLDFWKKQLADARDAAIFPKWTDAKQFHPLKYETNKDIEDHNKVKAVADSLGISVKSIYFAAYIYLIYRLSGALHGVTGLTSMTRPVGEDADRMMGCFLNIVPFTYKIDTHVPIGQFARHVHSRLITVSEFDKLSLFEIGKLMADAGRKHISLIGNYFTYNDFEILNEKRREHENASVLPLYKKLCERRTEHVDIPFQLTVNKGHRHVRYIFQTSNSCVEQFLAEQIGNLYATIIDQFITDMEAPLAGIDLTSHEEKSRLLYDFNNTDRYIDSSKTIIDFFEEHVLTTPDAIAVEEEGRSLSYDILNKRANALAARLLAGAPQKETVAGLMLDRGVDLMIAVIGIMKAGLVYLPIVPALPPDRIQYMLDNSNCSLVITNRSISPPITASLLYIEDISEKERILNPRIPIGENDLAYIIYTSGTTGRPKGVGIEHRSLLNRLHWMIRHFNISAGDAILQKTPISFDVSIWELFLWMIPGARLCMLAPYKEGDPEEIIGAIAAYRVSILHFVPSMLKLFLEYVEAFAPSDALNSLRIVVCSGEALGKEQAGLFKTLLPQVLLSNLYGPTEATIDVTFYDCDDRPFADSVPIGKPIDNTRLLILSPELQLQPIGIVGQLFITGMGLARGYINNKEQTAAHFMQAPYYGSFRMYKTGDLGRWLPDGNIEYFGRNDAQIKIRGVRIEPEEIIFHMKKYPSVTDAAVHVIDDPVSGDPKLCCYYVSRAEPDIRDIKHFLHQSLMEYMIPAYFIRLEEFPLNFNGKLDRAQLPLPPMLQPDGAACLPYTGIQRGLATIWSDVLGLEQDDLDIDQDFFHLGGHSLNAMKIQSRILTAFNTNITLADIFRFPTIRDLAILIQLRITDKSAASPPQPISRASHKTYYPTSHQQRSLFFIQQLNRASTAYNIPLLMQVMDNNISWGRIKQAMDMLVERHPIFGTTYSMIHGQLMQRVSEPAPTSPSLVELNGSMYAIEEMLTYIRPFDLQKEHSYKVTFFQQGNDRYILLDIHHIAIDGVGLTILFSDFFRLLKGEPLPAGAIGYNDYCEWLSSADGLRMIEKQGIYWLNEFRGYSSTNPLPFAGNTSRTFDFEGRQLQIQLQGDELASVMQIIKDNQCTLFMFICLTYGILLYKLSGAREHIIGCPISARSNIQLEEVIGMFANTLAIRMEINEKLSFLDMLARVRVKVLQAYQHQDYPFELLVDKLNIRRERGRNPLFDSCIVLQNFNDKMTFESNILKIIRSGSNSSKFDLLITGSEANGILNLTFEYNSKLFAESAIKDLVKRFRNIITQLMEDPGIQISKLRLITKEEEESTWNQITDHAQKIDYDL